MPLLLLVIAGIILLLNSSWFAGASIVGGILLAVGVIGFLWFLVVMKFVAGIIKEVKGPGTPRFPRR